jgi:hypothetical protein
MNSAVDMSDFIAAKSDQLNADDLMDSPRTITITKVTAAPDSADQPVAVHYQGGEGRPFKPCKTCRRIMVAIWGKDTANYIGRSMTLYRDPDVQFGGMKVGGIRISHMSNMDGDKTVALLVTRGRKAPFKVQALKAAPAAQTQGDAFGLPPVDEAATARKKAESWTEQYLAAVKDCSTIEALMERQAKSSETLAKLKGEHEDLHELAVNAGTQRASELQAGAYA